MIRKSERTQKHENYFTQRAKTCLHYVFSLSTSIKAIQPDPQIGSKKKVLLCHTGFFHEFHEKASYFVLV